MTPQQEIEAALARLEGRKDAVWSVHNDRIGSSDVTTPLAALIRATNAVGEYCICGALNPNMQHTPNCELLALVRAINGGTP